MYYFTTLFSMNTIISELKKFTLFVALFIGTGFIAGSIVHFGEGVTIWDTSVLLLGIFLFVAASYIEKYKHLLTLTSFLLFIFQSLLLAIGIGMASGGTQHFVDTPAYAAILIPLGFCIGLWAFFWREKVSLSVTKWILLICISAVCGSILWIALTYFDTILPDSIRVGHGSHGLASQNEAHTNSHAHHSDHGAMVQSEADFIQLMIPHHQEAVDTSNLLLSKGATGELAEFLHNIVKVQSDEIAMMKQWHLDWYGKQFVDTGRYELMMLPFEQLNLEEATLTYLHGMIVHHEGAVQMANRLPEITKRPVLLQFGKDIISLQSAEIELMNKWVKELHVQTSGH